MSEKIPIPAFAKEQLSQQKCIMCESQLKLSSVIACGIKTHKDGQTYFYYETQCKKCHNQQYTIFTSKPMDMSTFLNEMNNMEIDDISNYPKLQKTKITDQEFKNIKSKLDNSNTDSEILFHIGITPEMIEKYCKEDNDEDK